MHTLEPLRGGALAGNPLGWQHTAPPALPTVPWTDLALKVFKGAVTSDGLPEHALAHPHQRGVMHGDFYAHNILWHPGTGAALLGDFGVGTLLPSDDAAHARALLALEVRAFGHSLEELLACMDTGATAHGRQRSCRIA